jgi:hypothetical protein
MAGVTAIGTDLRRFHELIQELANRQGGTRLLHDSSGRDGWPSHGVYFFYEQGEILDHGQPRVVRVGTHALIETSRTTLWTRLGQHRGNLAGSSPDRNGGVSRAVQVACSGRRGSRRRKSGPLVAPSDRSSARPDHRLGRS